MSTPVVQTCGLTKYFGTHCAVHNLSLSIEQGEALALLGPNGAGKTTTVRLLACLLKPTSGSARVLGQDLSDRSGRRQIRARVGLLTESPGLYDRASGYYNLLYFARLQGLEDPEPAVEKYLRRLDLWDQRDQLAASFSKGMKQRLAIARALIHEPDLIFLDEPTSGLDPAAARRLREFLLELKAQGRTILLTTHNLAEAERLADRIIVMRTNLIAADTAAALRRRIFGQRTRIVAGSIPSAALESVRALPFVRELSCDNGTLTVDLGDPEHQNPAVVRELVKAGVAVQWVTDERISLEDVYLELLDPGVNAAASEVQDVSN